MKKYRFYHQFNSITTETYINANSKDEAIKKFRKMKGDVIIFNIECCDDYE